MWSLFEEIARVLIGTMAGYLALAFLFIALRTLGMPPDQCEYRRRMTLAVRQYNRGLSTRAALARVCPPEVLRFGLACSLRPPYQLVVRARIAENNI